MFMKTHPRSLSATLAFPACALLPPLRQQRRRKSISVRARIINFSRNLPLDTTTASPQTQDTLLFSVGEVLWGPSLTGLISH